MSEHLAENLLAHQKVLLSYLATNVWLNALTLIGLLVVAFCMWKCGQSLERIERKRGA